jgi:hypothetical protein
VTKLTEGSSQTAASSVPINQVMYWGIGEVGLKDVNMAKAGDGTVTTNHAQALTNTLLKDAFTPASSSLLICAALIIAYNVGVERSAARLALVRAHPPSRLPQCSPTNPFSSVVIIAD